MKAVLKNSPRSFPHAAGTFGPCLTTVSFCFFFFFFVHTGVTCCRTGLLVNSVPEVFLSGLKHDMTAEDSE